MPMSASRPTTPNKPRTPLLLTTAPLSLPHPDALTDPAAHHAHDAPRWRGPKHPAGQLRRRLASEVVRDVRTLDRRIAELDQSIATEMKASGTMLTEIFGVGPILAAKILGIVGDVSRFPSKAHFASSEQAWRRSKLAVARWSGTGSRLPATALSTRSHAHDRSLPGSQRSSRPSVSSEEAGGGQVVPEGDALPQAAHLRCGVQCAGHRFAGRFANGPLTQRGLELQQGELLRIHLPRTRVNKGKRKSRAPRGTRL